MQGFATVQGILRRAEIDPFGRCFHVLRQSCETEWAARFPQHTVSAWLGHSERVSEQHYLMVTDELYDLASGRAARIAAKSAAAGSRTDSQGVANGRSDKDMSPQQTPIAIG